MTATALTPTGEAASEPRVLIVDDDPAMTDLLFSLLAPFCEVHIEHDGFGGLSAYRRALQCGRPFDIVCIDLRMPGMDGRRTLRAIRRLELADQRGRRAHLLMMTTEHERALVIDVLEAGVDDFLVKPVDSAQLLARLGLMDASEDAASDAASDAETAEA